MCKCCISGWPSVAMETVCSSLPSGLSWNTLEICCTWGSLANEVLAKACVCRLSCCPTTSPSSISTSPEFWAMIKATLFVPGWSLIKPHSLCRGFLLSACDALNMKLITGCPTWEKWRDSMYRKGGIDENEPSPGSSDSQLPSSQSSASTAGFSSADCWKGQVILLTWNHSNNLMVSIIIKTLEIQAKE